MDRIELQARKDQLWGYMERAKDLAKLFDVMQISGTRADMRKLEELIAEVKRMN